MQKKLHVLEPMRSGTCHAKVVACFESDAKWHLPCDNVFGTAANGCYYALIVTYANEHVICAFETTMFSFLTITFPLCSIRFSSLSE